MRDKYVGWLALLGIATFVVFILYSFVVDVRAFIPDHVFFIFVTIVLYIGYERWRLNLPIYASVIIGLILHSAGVFGWYHISPIPIAWERITHFFGILPLTLLFYNYFRPNLEKKCWTGNNVRYFLVILFVSLGIGALVEIIEFWGYLSLGFGEGALMFGAGDGVAGKTGQELIDVLGGGWINAGWDLTFNLLGALVGLAIMMIVHYAFKKK